MASDNPNSQDASDLHAAASATGLQQPTLDDFFNFELVSFQVENKIFRVPKNGFNTPGTTFEVTFPLPPGQGAIGPGSNARPIRLEGIRENHFRAFLRKAYRIQNQPPMVEFDDWVGVLKLSTMCDLKNIRAEAIKALTPLVSTKSPLEKIHLGRQYKVSTWIRKGYIELIRTKSLKLNEMIKPPKPLPPLDWKTIAKIYHIRDTHKFDVLSSQHLCPTCYKHKNITTMYGRCTIGHQVAFDPSTPSTIPTETCSETFVDSAFRSEFEETMERDN